MQAAAKTTTSHEGQVGELHVVKIEEGRKNDSYITGPDLEPATYSPGANFSYILSSYCIGHM